MLCGFVVPGAAWAAYLFVLREPGAAPHGAVGLAAQIALSVGGLYAALLAAIHFLVLRRRGITWREIGFRPAAPRWYAAGALILALWWTGSLVIYQVFGLLSDANEYQRSALMPQDFGWLLLLPIALAIGPLAALLEETLFRGLLFRWLRRRFSLGAAAGASAALFALVHFNFLVPGGAAGLLMTAEIFAIGVALAIMVEKSGSLLPGIILHAVNNLAVLLYLART